MSSEARARLAGEAELIRRHRAPFDRLLKSRARPKAIVALVEKYKTEYAQLVSAFRARFEADGKAA